MTLVLELSPELEARLERAAAEANTDVATFVVTAAAEKAANPFDEATFAALLKSDPEAALDYVTSRAPQPRVAAGTSPTHQRTGQSCGRLYGLMAFYLVDTNVWARRLESNSPLNAVARRSLHVLRGRGDELAVVPQVIYELWAVATRPATARGGLGYSAAEMIRRTAALQRFGRLFPDSPAIFPAWQRLVALYQVKGVPTHDTRLVAAMEVHGLTHILTFNTSDFARYVPEGITPVHPHTL